MNRPEVRQLLHQAGVRPSKRLGQNFLVDRTVVESIADWIRTESPHLVIEIGPGLGVVTEALGRVAERVVAVELDRRLASLVEKRFRDQGNVAVEIGDVLKFNIAEAAAGRGRAIVFGSLPYRSTAPILKYLIAQRDAIEAALLITQQEVAEKLAASPGRDGTALGVLVRAYAEIEILRPIGRGSFEPSPDVESTLWALRFLDEPRFGCDAEAFFLIVRAIYGSRRKMLRRVLQQLVPASAVATVLESADIPGDVRGETLGFEDLERLARAVSVHRLKGDNG